MARVRKREYGFICRTFKKTVDYKFQCDYKQQRDDKIRFLKRFKVDRISPIYF